MSKMMGFLFIALTTFSLSAFAQQSGGGGSDGVKNTCEVSGGTFTGSESGNWACCWADWGCYGCVDGNCKIKCYNERCRKANGISRASANEQAVDGLAPKGMKAPIAPKKSKTLKQEADSHNTIKN